MKAFVGAAHSKLDLTKEMLAETPALLNASWDGGGGDFETGLGHEIAEFLIGQGARADPFAAAMLERLETVRAKLASFPGIERSLGPHKIPLLAHATREKAENVIEYLKTLKN